MSEEIKNNPTETKKEKTTIKIKERPVFKGGMKTDITTSIEIADFCNAMFAAAMHDFMGCKISINTGTDVVVANSGLPAGALYVDLYFRDNGKSTGAIKNLINIYTADEGRSMVGLYDDIQSSIVFQNGDVVMFMGYTSAEVTSVKIDSTITEIAAGAFYGTAMTEIVFGGTKDEWDALKKGKAWDGGIEAYTVKCSDGDIVIAPEVEEAPETEEVEA